MKNKDFILSRTRLKRLRDQGYTCESQEQLSRMAFGIRFPYQLCVAVLLAAIAAQSILIFAAMLFIAFLGIVMPNHPFDYIYNYVLSGPMNKPIVPPRANQLKFACTIATCWLSMVLFLMISGNITAGLVLAGILVGIALLPATIDLCVPSLIYNLFFKNRTQSTI